MMHRSIRAVPRRLARLRGQRRPRRRAAAGVSLLGVTAFLVFGAGSLLAQEPPVVESPFTEINARLDRAADRQLELARHGGLARAMQPIHPALPAAVETARAAGQLDNDFPAPASLEAVGRAARRLAALGVDAAGIFSGEGVPLELLVVAQAESNFDPVAVSPRGARGLWQLMPATARQLGLQVNSRSDQRLRPRLSTLAAARYLRQLHAKFGDWLLTLAAYHAGEGRVQAAAEQAQTRNFFALARQGLLPAATRRYVLDVVNLLQR